MAKTAFNILTYQVMILQEDSVIFVRGEQDTVYIHFLNDDVVTTPNIWFPDLKFGHIYLRDKLLPTVIDILRNEKPVWCIMNDLYPSGCYIETGIEPVGEEERHRIF